MNKELLFYKTQFGRVSFRKWLSKLKDIRAKVQIKMRLDRVAVGVYGDCKYLNEGIYELRIHYGPGYRIYFAELKKYIVLLLIGGSKRTQTKDIKKAKEYWQTFKMRYDYE